jgi:hydrogenase maturation protein HypF
MALNAAAADEIVLEIRVRGRVQGVGFRPNVWRIAQELGLRGEVLNDGQGVIVRAGGSEAALAALLGRIEREPPPLGRIDKIETREFAGTLPPDFRIARGAGGAPHTEVTPDAGICAACAAEIASPFERRYRYPFTNCTHCGPRLSILRETPYDRAATTMAPFVMCAACAAEYANPADRRFHAEAIACHDCGPKARLIRLDGRVVDFRQHSMLDDVDAACSLIQKGEIVAIKGIGGYQLACDATNEAAVARLRAAKRRHKKPFALMARDLAVIRAYCAVSELEERLLTAPAAPIVLLDRAGAEPLPEAIAPGLATLGFMLPTTPLHVLLLRRMKRPVVMTSGNLAGAPQVIDDAQALADFAGIADYALAHNRAIANRVDDSVVRVMAGRPRVLRRARGFAPAAMPLPPGFAGAPDLLAMGGEQKSTFCVVKDGNAIVSPHQGDLEDPRTFDDYTKNLSLYQKIFAPAPLAVATDSHPQYHATKRGASLGLPVLAVQHHHAHVASCLAENAWPPAAPKVLGIVLDGAGLGDDGLGGAGTIWGGEFLLADYCGYERLGTFKPVALPGGDKAAREPWRNLYAHLMAEMSWPEFAMNFAGLEVFADLAARPRGLLDAMIAGRVNAPAASSCGRLFDAVAAALNICRDAQDYEGEAAARLEAMVDPYTLRHEDEALAYPFAIPKLPKTGLPYIEPLAMWQALLGDMILRTPAPVMAARFHKGLARVIVKMAVQLAAEGRRFDTVALSGGCFQNRILFEEVLRRLEAQNFRVLTHEDTPANDGGLALGQAAIAAMLCAQPRG